MPPRAKVPHVELLRSHMHADRKTQYVKELRGRRAASRLFVGTTRAGNCQRRAKLFFYLCVIMPPGGKLARFHMDQTGPSSGQRLRNQHVLVQLFAFSERSLGPLHVTGIGLDNLLLVYLEAEKRQSGSRDKEWGGWGRYVTAASGSVGRLCNTNVGRCLL